MLQLTKSVTPAVAAADFDRCPFVPSLHPALRALGAKASYSPVGLITLILCKSFALHSKQKVHLEECTF